MLRTLLFLSRTPLVPTEASKQAALGVQLTTFRDYTTSPSMSSGRIRSLSTSSTLGAGQNHTQTSPQAPDTDDVAHTDEAFEGGQSNPETSKKRIEGETGKSMDTTAADSKASEGPSGKGKHDVAGSSTVKDRKPGQPKK